MVLDLVILKPRWRINVNKKIREQSLFCLRLSNKEPGQIYRKSRTKISQIWGVQGERLQSVEVSSLSFVSFSNNQQNSTLTVFKVFQLLTQHVEPSLNGLSKDVCDIPQIPCRYVTLRTTVKCYVLSS